MSQIVSIHSFRGGTGKSNVTANLATVTAMRGKRVGVVDTDIASPGIHVLFGMGEEKTPRTLNDYLWGNCSIEDAAYDVTAKEVKEAGGQVFLIPSSIKTGEIVKILREAYDVGLLNDGFREVIQALDLDFLFIDTHPGLNEETLLSIAISDVLVILLRPDQQDFQGTSVTVEVARKLNMPRMYLVVNKFPTAFLDLEAFRKEVEETYGCPVAAILPLSEDLVRLGSAEVFYLKEPKHPFSRAIEGLANFVVTE
jgi:MinD-like ATPase involved in chromosome partitioning or flagellar assembly